MTNFRIPVWTKVEFHPYRTARPNMIMMSLSRDSEAGKELEELLLKKAKKAAENPDSIRMDNHVCFSFDIRHDDVSDESKLVVMCSDFDISIGVGLERKRW